MSIVGYKFKSIYYIPNGFISANQITLHKLYFFING
jgi:hypothetical protein